MRHVVAPFVLDAVVTKLVFMAVVCKMWTSAVLAVRSATIHSCFVAVLLFIKAGWTDCAVRPTALVHTSEVDPIRLKLVQLCVVA